jgi:PAS domain S-box-containing protein
MLNRLSTQIGMLFFLGIGLALGLYHWFDYTKQSEEFPQRIMVESTQSSQLIASSISNNVLYRNAFPLWKQMTEIQQRFSAHSDISLRGFTVTDADSLVLAGSDPLKHPIMLKMDLPDQTSRWQKDSLRVVQKILHPSDQRVIGYLILTFDTSAMQQHLNELKENIALSFIPAFLIALLLAVGMSFRVSAPLKQLTLLSERIGTGDVDIKAFSSKPLEIQALAYAIQRADQTIAVRTNELAKSDAQLARLALVVEQADEIIVVTDKDGVIEYVNPAFEYISGFTADEAIGATPRIVQSGQHSERYYVAMWNTLNSGKTWYGDFSNRSKRGDIYEVTQSMTPITNAEGEVTGFASVQRDVTQQRKMQNKLEHTDRVDSLGVLAGGIAHDFNNLLTAILGNISLAVRKMDASSPSMKHLQAVESASYSASDLCKQMLAYSGKGKFVVKAINLSELVENMGKLIDVSLAKNVVLKYHLTEHLPAIDADVAQMQQVILNLITNASEAIEGKSGVISMSTGMMQVNTDYLNGCVGSEKLVPGRYVSLEVSDSGCGMDAATQKKIFDPFFTTKFTGRGLGMSAMLGIVRGHQGALRIYSEPGEGTTIKVVFPTSGDSVVVLEPSVDVTAQAQFSGTALVIDDEETVREVACMMLEDIGFKVITAHDGLHGVEVFRQHQEEVVLVMLDMTMPKMGGEACFSQLKAIQPDVHVVLSSGYNEQDATSRFAGKGLAGFLQKPYTPEALEEKVQEILGDC